jgi:hypothetical protein
MTIPSEWQRRIPQARVENLMILYIDSFRQDGNQTPYYRQLPGFGGHVLGRDRSTFPQQLLPTIEMRQFLLANIEAKIQRLKNNRQWSTIDWLRGDFISRHVNNPPAEPLRTLTHLLEVARAAGTADDRAIVDLCRAMRDAANLNEHRNVFGTALTRGFGGTPHGISSPEYAAIGWANGLIQFIRTINELRQGRPPSRTAQPPNAPRVFLNVMVGQATVAWNRLSDAQRRAFTQEQPWQRLLAALWNQLKERLNWALQTVGSSATADTLDNGRYRNSSNHI